MSGQGKHKNLQLVQWLRNPWVRCDNVARGPIPEWQAALMFEAANVIEHLETTRTDLCITEAECQRRIDAAVLAERGRWELAHNQACDNWKELWEIENTAKEAEVKHE